MATIAYNNSYQLDMREWTFFYDNTGVPSNQTSTSFRLNLGNNSYDEYAGSGFTYGSFGDPVTGTINSITAVSNGKVEGSASGFAISVQAFTGYVTARNPYAILQGMFGGNDTIAGADRNDFIGYFGGNDVIDGKDGTDTVYVTLPAGQSASGYVTAQASDGSYRLVSAHGEAALYNVENIKIGNNAVTPLNSVSFDGLSYLLSNPDLFTVFGADAVAGARHYVYSGMSEGRSTSAFNALQYIASNPDLVAAFGTNTNAAIQHYINSGMREGRSVSAFNALRYLASNTDLIDAFGVDTTAAAQHYITTGRNEGRSSNSFNASSYLAANADLQAVFGSDQTAAMQHYVQQGRREGRATVPSTPARAAGASLLAEGLAQYDASLPLSGTATQGQSGLLEHKQGYGALAAVA